MHIKFGTVLSNEDQAPQEVYFLVKGCVLKESSEEKNLGIAPHFFIEGAMFGEKDVLQQRQSTETFKAMCDCQILHLSRSNFIMIMEADHDFREQVIEVATEREKLRIK